MSDNSAETRPVGAVKTLVVEDVAFSFRWAPPGTFTMGSPETERGRNRNEILREVTIENGFWILATPVTQRQFMLTKKRNPAAFCSTGTYRYRVVDLDTSDFPIENVSWFDAEKFCLKMTQKLRKAKAPFYFDLPSEEEWEYACRAGTSTPFAFGESLGNNANYCDSDERWNAWNYGRPHPKSPPRPTPVGSYPPNAWGIYDMHGNISEWVADWYPAYEDSSDCPELFAAWRYPDSTEESLAQEFPRERFKIVRGGSWYSGAWAARSAYRGFTSPDLKDETFGFRVVLRDAAPEVATSRKRTAADG